MYIVQVTNVPKCYKPGYFPREYLYLSDAKRCALLAIASGAGAAAVQLPGGTKIDFTPAQKKGEAVHDKS